MESLMPDRKVSTPATSNGRRPRTRTNAWLPTRSDARTLITLGWFVGLVVCPVDARGGDCLDYGEFVHLVGSVDTPGLASDVAVAGTSAT